MKKRKSTLSVKKPDETIETNTMKQADDQKEASDERAGLHDSGDDPKVKVDYSTEYAFSQGRQAADNAIGEDDCPYGDGTDKQAWLAGWKKAKHG